MAAPRLQHAGQRRGEGRPIPQLLLNERPHPVQELLCSPATPPSVRCTLIHFIRLTALAVATKHCSTASPSIGAGMPTGTGAPPGVPCVLEGLQELRATGKGHPKYEKAAAAGCLMERLSHMRCAIWLHAGRREGRHLIPQQDELLHGDGAGGQHLQQRHRPLRGRLPVPGAGALCRGGGDRATALTSRQHCSCNARCAGQEDWGDGAAAHQTSTSVHLS